MLTLPGDGVPEPDAGAGNFRDSVRGSEWVLVIFLIYSAAAAMLLPAGFHVRERVALWNLGTFWPTVCSFISIATSDPWRSASFAIGCPWRCCCSPIRRWAGSPRLNTVIPWRRTGSRGTVFSCAKALRPPLKLSGLCMPSILEIAYSLVYTLAPFCLAVLYIYRRRDRVDRFLFLVTIGVLLCYAQFPFWPSEPPRVVFLGQDLPSSDTIFRRFNLWLLGNAGIHTSVFPSAHVAAAFSAAFGMWRTLPEHKWVGRFLFVMAFLIAIATIYGRYHYFADAAAGLSMAFGALALTMVRDARRLSAVRSADEPPAASEMEHA